MVVEGHRDRAFFWGGEGVVSFISRTASYPVETQEILLSQVGRRLLTFGCKLIMKKKVNALWIQHPNTRCRCLFVVFVFGKVILNGVKFCSGRGELFLESLRQVVEILSQSPDYKGDRTGRWV